MAVCNIFKKLEKDTGTFLMFSQYVEDITRESTQSCYYHVTPSKFIALDIDYSAFNGKCRNDNNENIAVFLQNYFENGCAIARSKISADWTPEYSKNLFWSAMFGGIDNNVNLLKERNDEEGNIVEEIKYIGDINLQSYNEHDGVGYSEIYCYIPSEARQCNYSISDKMSVEQYSTTTLQSGDFLEGYSVDDFVNWGENDKSGSWGYINNTINYTPYRSFEYGWESEDEIKKETDDTSFNINTIIVLYDVTTKSSGVNASEIIYKNIPMGIYFTGKLDNIGNMSNHIVKYTSNPDIYNTGTSYGLRLCSRFTVTPNQDNIKTIEITSSNEDYSTISQLLSQMSVSQAKMDEVVSDIYSNSQTNKELISLFKNYRTNVPYIKVINGKKYWYVNGRNVAGVTDGLEECGCEPYDEETIRNMLKGAYNLVIDFNATYKNSNIVDLSLLKQNEVIDIDLSWNITYKDHTVETNAIDGFWINGIIREPNYGNIKEPELAKGSKVESVVVNSSKAYEKYVAEVVFDGMEAKSEKYVHMCYPSYIGVAYIEDIETAGSIDAEKVNNLIKTINSGKDVNGVYSDDRITFKRMVQPTKSVSYTYSTKSETNGNTQHIIYMYPVVYGRLTSITDSDYEYFPIDFKLDDKKITHDNGVTVSYYICIDEIPSHVQNYTLKFS